jgi:UDP-glucose 4-epimerase
VIWKADEGAAGGSTAPASQLVGLDVAITGGAGFIGSHLLEQVQAQGAASVVVIDDLSTGSTANLDAVSGTFHFLEGDVRDPAMAKQAGEAHLIFHLAVRNVRASIKDPAENLSVNAGGTLAVLEAVRHGRRGRFVYVSSSEIYGIPPSGEFSEDVLPAPTTVYGAGKLAGELLAQAYHRTYGLQTQVIRPFNNFGPRSHFEGDSGEVIPKFVLRALAGEPLIIHGNGTQTRDFMFVHDTARWLVELSRVDGLVGEVVNIGSGREIRVVDLANAILEITGSSSQIVHVEERPGDLPRLCADVSKVTTMVPFRLTTGFEDGLSATIDHFRRQNPRELLRQESERNWL